MHQYGFEVATKQEFWEDYLSKDQGTLKNPQMQEYLQKHQAHQSLKNAL